MVIEINERFKEIYNRLKDWRDERNISVESQQEGYLPNILQELGEVGKEIAKNNEAGIVAELCDLVVVAMNACDEEKFKDSIYPDTTNANRPLTKVAGVKDRQDKLGLSFDENLCILIHNLANYKYEIFYGYCLIEAVVRIWVIVESLGYDFNKAMDETLKKIESREGYWNDSAKKWIKTATKYTPDYERCRL